MIQRLPVFFASQVTGVKRSKITTYAHVTMQGILKQIIEVQFSTECISGSLSYATFGCGEN